MRLRLEHRAAGPWILPNAVTFGSDIESTGLMIGLPCYGGVLTAPTLRGLLETQAVFNRIGLPFACATLTNESLVSRARNTLVSTFLASSASHLLFLDSDIGFGADGVLRLLGHQRPVIGGLYRRKQVDRVAWAASPMPVRGGAPRRDPATGAVEVEAIGTGFLLIVREVFVNLAGHLPQTRYRTEEGAVAHALFESGIAVDASGEGSYFGEDYIFCARWRAAGGDVWSDPAVVLHHHGQIGLKGDPSETFR